MDKNGNQTLYEYSGETLERIRFASGQYLEFLWQGNKLVQMKDCLQRTVTYQYEGDFLTAVGMVTGERERYAYNQSGFLNEITDANGVTSYRYDSQNRLCSVTVTMQGIG